MAQSVSTHRRCNRLRSAENVCHNRSGDFSPGHVGLQELLDNSKNHKPLKSLNLIFGWALRLKGLFIIQFKPVNIDLDRQKITSLSMPGFVLRATGRHQATACLMAITLALLNVAPIELQRRAIDNAIPAPDLNLLAWLIGAYLALMVLLELNKFLLNTYQAWIGESVNCFLRRMIIDGESISHAHFSHEASDSEIATVIGSETASYSEFVGQGFSQVIIDISMLLGVAIYMFVVEPKIAIFAAALLVPQAILTPMMQARLNALLERKLRLRRELSRDVVGTRNYADAEATTMQLFGNNMQFSVMKFALKSLLGLLSALGPILIIGVGGYYAIYGETTIGVIVAFLAGFRRIEEPARGVVTFYRNAAQANVQHRMISNWLARN